MAAVGRALRALLLFVALGLVVVALVGYGVFADRSLPGAATTVDIPIGSTARDIGLLLQQHGIVRSALAFEALTRLEHKSARLKAGEFAFDAHRPLADVLEEVTGVGKQVATWITIPEGFTVREIAQTLADRGVGPYDAFANTFLESRLDVDGTIAPSLEGYLFPDTYLVPEHASPQAVARIMTTKFFSELPPNAPALAKRLGLTVPQVVTVASLVEREAKADDERALMAGVYYNRLRRHMPLQVDATIEYTFAHHKDVITYADLATDSPYNTYKVAGLPPTPIANPGLPSLLAAFHPKKSDFYYYVYMGNGHSAFARTLAEHEANVAKYLK